MRAILIPALLVAGALAGCGGGGGGGGPAPNPTGSFTGQASGAQSFTLTANVTGAVASGARVTVYGDQRTGPMAAYTDSKRLTLTLFGPVQPGTYPVSPTGAAGTSSAVYVETTLRNALYVTTGTWRATEGSVTVNAADGRHIEGAFTLTTRNESTSAALSWQHGRFNVRYDTPPAPPS